jgi:hypothetical protein
MEMCSLFEDALPCGCGQSGKVSVIFLHDLAGTISAVAPLVVVSATGIHDHLAPTANGRFALEHQSQVRNLD